MIILGHGIDIVDIARIERSLAEYGDRFRDRVYTPTESGYCGDSKRPGPHFAVRFAAKEATFKALGTGWRSGIAWTDVEIVNLPSGAPSLRIRGEAERIARQLGIVSWLVSLSHTDHTATASVLAIGA